MVYKSKQQDTPAPGGHRSIDSPSTRRKLVKRGSGWIPPRLCVEHHHHVAATAAGGAVRHRYRGDLELCDAFVVDFRDDTSSEVSSVEDVYFVVDRATIESFV